jgi:hypothetical protein
LQPQSKQYSLSVINRISKFDSVHSLLKNGMSSWLAQYKPSWDSLLTRTSSQLESPIPNRKLAYLPKNL